MGVLKGTLNHVNLIPRSAETGSTVLSLLSC